MGLAATSALVYTLPAEATQLRFWRFDQQRNQLVFNTDSPVQPRAQMVFNPTRVVIDLPGTTLGRPSQRQAVGGAIREVRSGQFDSQTARLVIELAPGYTMDPRAVEVRGVVVMNGWCSCPNRNNPGAPRRATGGNSVTGEYSTNGAMTFLSGVVTTADGFFMRTSGEMPTINLERRGQPGGERQIIIDLFDSSISPFLKAEALPNSRYSVSRWDITQDPQRNVTRVVMTLAPGSPDWEVTPTNIGTQTGIVLVPPSGVSISSVPDNPSRGNPQIAVPPTAQPSNPRPQPSLPPQPTTPTFPPSVNNGRVRVAIDPGHGGRDPGAVGIGGLQEKNVVFPVSMRVAELLREAGVDVVMTRTTRCHARFRTPYRHCE
jgi:N-acetylmuramoyl-L-alanine amidase